MALLLMSWTATADIVMDLGAGVLLSPQQLTNNYNSAAGLKAEILLGWRVDPLTYFLIGNVEEYGHSSRNANANIDSGAVGPGVMFHVAPSFALYGYVQYGSGRYSLYNGGQKIADGKNDFFKATAGGRFYFPLASYFAFYAGPEVSYTTMDFDYPASYTQDESQPVHFNVGGVGGVSFSY